MRDEYDFSGAVKNPYAKKEKQQVTINLDSDVIVFFKETAAKAGIPYQTLINLYLADCAERKLQPNITWQ